MCKNFAKIAVFLLFVVVSCSDNPNIEVENSTITFEKVPLSTKLINESINKSLKTTGEFYWKNVSLQMLWSATQHGNKVVTIGFGADKDDFDKSKSSKSKEIQAELFTLIANSEKQEISKILVNNDQFLNFIDVYINEPETLQLLRRNPHVRYIEPADYNYSKFEGENHTSKSLSFGCGYGTDQINPNDYTTEINARVPWTFSRHNIPSAWKLSRGAGVTVGVIDTGVSPEQSSLGNSFSSGSSTRRTITKLGTYEDSFWPWITTTDGPNDKCGHGTSMAATVAAPRNGKDKLVGVAYQANLVTVRASSDVVLTWYKSHSGVQNAFTILGNMPNVKIISMSMGAPYFIGKIADGVLYAYKKGKLIFCAAGTTLNSTTAEYFGVVFPASMTQVSAVTGVKDTENYYSTCENCHNGPAVDFTIKMERLGSGRNMPVISYYNNKERYVGGSSVATATAVGIAALVWSKYPTWTRNQVLRRMEESSELYPNRSSYFGYGNIDASLAVK